MQTSFAQIISLISYANHYLKNGVVMDDYFPANSVFQFCDSVNFINFTNAPGPSIPGETVVATDPPAWFKLLKDEGCQHVRLFYRPVLDAQAHGPEYQRVGFIGSGGNWMIETNFGPFSQYWSMRWQVKDKDAADKRIWEVSYGRQLERYSPANMQRNVVEVRKELSATLNALCEFCTEQELKIWFDWFVKAQQTLESFSPNILFYHHDLVVTQNYPLTAQQLLFAAANAWVFGGMGSWNDMGFKDAKIQERYSQLSQQLFEQIVAALLAVINSY